MPLIDPQLKEILVCPCPQHGSLLEDEAAGVLRCTQCHRAYPVQDGIPVMLLEEAIVSPEHDSQNGATSEAVADSEATASASA